MNELREQLLLDRIKFIGDGEFTLTGTPAELISEIDRLLAAADEPGLGVLDDLHVWEILIDPHFGSDAQPKGYRATFLSDDEDGDSFVAASGIGPTRMDAIRAAVAQATATQEGASNERPERGDS